MAAAVIAISNPIGFVLPDDQFHIINIIIRIKTAIDEIGVDIYKMSRIIISILNPDISVFYPQVLYNQV